MSAGDGYRYLLKSVAAGDGDRALATPLTRYYIQEGTPPGRWIGSGLSAFGRGDLKVGARVTEEQLQRLIGLGRDPLTGAPLGRAYPVYVREGGTDTVGDGENADVVASADRRRAVAGFDFTFSVPKSASVLWAVADARTQSVIVEEHHAAVADVLAFIERELAATRVGVAALDGAVAQVSVAGLAATAFDHFDSRAGDPHLHTHVVISNKVQAELDGRWRSLDGRPLHAATVALSELHESLFADRLTRRLGLAWERRERGRDRNPGWSIVAVPEVLVSEFSSRSREIDIESDRLIHEYVQQHGRHPSTAAVIRLRQQATLATRPEKTVRPLAVLTADWRSRAGDVLGTDVEAWVCGVLRDAPSLSFAGDPPTEALAGVALVVVDRVGERRSTWRRWNLYAEAARQTMGWRFSSGPAREEALAAIVAGAERVSVRLTPPDLTHVPLEFQRDDGSSVFRPKHSAVYSSRTVLVAEDRLLALADDSTGPVTPGDLFDRGGPARNGWARSLSNEQHAAVTAIAASGRVVDVLVGPAGAGKTTTMAGLRALWESAHGPGSVIGLAPSATAAQALGNELGIPTENTAMWLQLEHNEAVQVHAGQLVIVDEASLAGTATLDRIAQHAHRAGAKLLLVGDSGQLSAVEAGGAFAMLATARGDGLVELTDVRRFKNEWERTASLGIRDGDLAALDDYIAHDRVRDGDAESVLDAAYAAWREDVAGGASSVLIANDSETVTALNRRARADLVLAGRVDARREVRLHDQSNASVGDTVITRRNDRRLRTMRSWVRNGDRWRVRAVRSDGSLLVQATGVRRGGRVVLPSSYVNEHVELGYAITPYRAQGATTDTGHVVVNSTTTREQLYVALTRGRRCNTIHVAVDRTDEAHSTRHPADEPAAPARSVLAGVLQHVGAQQSAHETIVNEQENWGSIAQLAAEYESIAAAAQHPRWAALIRSSGLGSAEAAAVIASDAFGPLAAELRRAEASGHDVDSLLPRLVAIRDFRDADDPAAVLHARLRRASTLQSGARQSGTGFIAGLVAPAAGPMAGEMRCALEERGSAIERRASAVLELALENDARWLAELGGPDRHVGTNHAAWKRSAMVIAAFRDRYNVLGRRALGAGSARAAEADLAVAAQALRTAQLEVQRGRSVKQRTFNAASDDHRSTLSRR